MLKIFSLARAAVATIQIPVVATRIISHQPVHGTAEGIELELILHTDSCMAKDCNSETQKYTVLLYKTPLPNVELHILDSPTMDFEDVHVCVHTFLAAEASRRLIL